MKLPSETKKFLVVSSRRLMENLFRELTLVEALKVEGFVVDFCLVGRNISPYGYEKSDIPRYHQFKGAIFLDSLQAVRNIANQYDAVLFDAWKAMRPVANIFHEYKLALFDYCSGGGFDHHSFPSQISFFRSDALVRCFHKECEMRHGFTERDHLAEIQCLGGMLHEYPRDTKFLNKEEFYNKYNLDPDKPILVFFPKAIAGFREKLRMWYPGEGDQLSDWYIQTYDRIVNITSESNFQVIVKLHPTAYTSYRSKSDDERQFWKKYEFIRILDPQDTHSCFSYCTVGSSVVSHSAMDMAYYSKPMLYIESKNAVMPYDTKILGLPEISNLPIGPSLCWDKSNLQSPNPYLSSWVGEYSSIEELPNVLRQKNFLKCKPEHYEMFIKQFWTSNDGLSSSRIAKAIKKWTQENSKLIEYTNSLKNIESSHPSNSVKTDFYLGASGIFVNAWAQAFQTKSTKTKMFQLGDTDKFKFYFTSIQKFPPLSAWTHASLRTPIWNPYSVANRTSSVRKRITNCINQSKKEGIFRTYVWEHDFNKVMMSEPNLKKNVLHYERFQTYPFIENFKDWEFYNNNLSSKLKFNIRRSIKKLENQGKLEFSFHEPLSKDEIVEFYLKFTAKKWEFKGLPNKYQNAQYQKFLKAICDGANQEGKLRLSTLRLNGEIISLHIGFQIGNVFYYVYPAYSGHYAVHSPGIILLYMIVKYMSAPDSGVEIVDLGAGLQGYKSKFSNNHIQSIVVDICAQSHTQMFYRVSQKLRHFAKSGYSKVKSFFVSRANLHERV